MGVSFLNPLLFSLAGLVALPIIAHLIQRRRGRDLFFPTIRFLVAAQEEYRKRVRLQHRHLLYLRAGAFVVLTFTLTQPVIRVADTQLATGSTRTSAIVLVDTSYSMATNDNGVVRMDRAKQLAKDVMRVFREGDQIALIAFSTRGNEVLVPLSVSSGLLDDRLANIRPLPFSSDISGALAQAENLLKDTGDDLKEIYLISDLQAVAGQNIKSGSPTDKPMNLHVLSVGPANARNTAVVDISSSPAAVPQGGNATIRALLKHFGPDPKRHALVQLVSGPGQTDRLHLDLPPNAPQAASFTKSFSTSGLQAEKVTVETDVLPIDNERYHVVSVSTQAEALVVDGRPGAMDGRGASFFVVKALEACGLGSSKLGSTAIDIRKMDVPGDVPPTEFTRYAMVVFCDVCGFTADAVRGLSSYVSNGGAFLAFMGPKTDPGNINRTLVPKILPYPLMAPKHLPGDRPNRGYYFKTVDYQSPIFELFKDLENGNIMLPRYTNYQVVKVDEDKEKAPRKAGERFLPQAAVLAKFDTKDPAVISIELGRGRGLFFLSSPDREWTDLPLRSIFVPIVGEALAYLASGGSRTVAFKPGDPVVITVKSRDVAKDTIMLTVVGPNDEEYTVAASPTGTIARGFFIQTESPGFYRVSAPPELKDVFIMPSVFCVNLDTVESDLAGMSEEDFDEALLGRFKVDHVKPSPFVGERLSKAREGFGLWSYLLLMLWAIIMVETLYANRLTQT